MTQSSIRVFLVGLGRMGMVGMGVNVGHKDIETHLGYILQDSRFSLIGAWDVDVNRTNLLKQYLGQDFNITNKLRYVQADCFVVATPAETHLDLIKEIAQNKSVRVIVCEKPLGHNFISASEIEDLLRRKGISCFVNYQRSNKVKELPFYGDLKNELASSSLVFVFVSISDKSGSALPHIINLLLTIDSNLKETIFQKFDTLNQVPIKLVIGRSGKYLLDFKFFNLNENSFSSISILTNSGIYLFADGFSRVRTSTFGDHYGWISTANPMNEAGDLLNDTMVILYNKVAKAFLAGSLFLDDITIAKHTHNLVDRIYAD